MVCQYLIKLGISSDIWSVSSKELNKIIVDHLNSTMPLLDTSNSLRALKVIREKRIAHRELMDISISLATTYYDSFNLISYAQNFAIVIGIAYISTIYSIINEHFFLGENAERSSSSMKKIVGTLLRNDS